MNVEQMRLINGLASAGQLHGCFRISATVNGGLVFDWHPGYVLPWCLQSDGKKATVQGDQFEVCPPAFPTVPVLLRVPRASAGMAA